ncbi:MAG: LptF/LptG family permease, partial [Chitinophagales bacterium]
QLLKVEWHRKFTLAISCLVLFFVGAPLGAIIKKGGIGLPMFISVILFIIYYMLTKISSEFAQQEKVTPFLGMWFSTMLFLPLGIFLTYKAMNDSQMMNIEGFANWVIEKFSKKNVDRQ